MVILLAAVSQGILAAFHPIGDMCSPNAATMIGYSLADHGVYEGGWWIRLRGPTGKDDPGIPRMFHLPGEPLYTVAGLKVLPQGLLRFLHVPVTTLLIACAAWWGMKLGGRTMGLITGLIGTFHPFVLLHGMVWDDTFLSAALDWLAAGIILAVLLRPQRQMTGAAWLGVLLASGYTAITRAASQLVFGVLGLLLLLARKLRHARAAGIAIILGMAIALLAWGNRNRQISGHFFLGSTHDGITLWESNYPSAIEALVKTGAEERLNNQRMQNDFAITRHMGELKANQYFLHRARQYMLQHPWATLRTGLIKLADDISGWSFDSPALGARNLISCASNGLMILLALPALIGANMWRKSEPPVRQWISAVFATQLLVTFLLLFFGPSSLRYWMSVQPILWMADAWTIAPWIGV